jgi:hypothetical protein
MSYFNPVLEDPEKYRRTPVFRSLKHGVSDTPGAVVSPPKARRALVWFSRRRGNLKELGGGWSAGREA